jgi:8-oxo-dGTP diphosphatase
LVIGKWELINKLGGLELGRNQLRVTVNKNELPLANDAASRYQVIPRVLCFVTEADDVLLLKGAPDKRLWAGLYNGLGGHVEAGESVYAAARREIMEEAGLAVTSLRLCAVVMIEGQSSPAGIGMFVFTAQAANRQVRASAEGALYWVPVSQIGGLETVEDLPRLVPLVLGLPPGAPPLGGHYSNTAGGELRMAFFDEVAGLDQPL